MLLDAYFAPVHPMASLDTCSQVELVLSQVELVLSEEEAAAVAAAAMVVVAIRLGVEVQ